jgi:hypothetical protein
MSDELVTIRTFSNQGEAQIARGLLESCGIPVFLGDENLSRMENPVLIGGSKLQVRATDANTARELLMGVKSESRSQGQ